MSSTKGDLEKFKNVSHLEFSDIILRIRKEINCPFLHFVNLFLLRMFRFLGGNLFVCLKKKTLVLQLNNTRVDQIKP